MPQLPKQATTAISATRATAATAATIDQLPKPLIVDSKGPSIDLPYQFELRDYQRPLWDYMMQTRLGLRAITVWPRRNGKDLVALNILIAKAVQKVGLYLYIGPLHTQTRQIVWLGGTNEGRKFLDYFPKEIVARKRDAVMEIELINGSLIKVVGSDQYNNLMGLNAFGSVFTEYSLQKPEAWEYIRPMMSANGGWALFNGTPRGYNHFYQMHKMATANEEWFSQYLTRDDTNVPTVEAIASEREAGMRESLIEQEFYCSWTSSSEETFIPLELIEPCVNEDHRISEDDYKHHPLVFGCDVAYAAKGDKATIVARQGRKVHFIRYFQGLDNMAFAREIGRLIKLLKPTAVFIDAGRGEGVISRLEQLGYDHLVRGVHFGGKVYEEGYANMKALMWFRALTWFLSPDKPDMTKLDESDHANGDVEELLITELSTPFMLRDEKNQVKVEPKSSLKSRGFRSPDLAEGLCLTFAEEIEPDEVVDSRLAELGLTADVIAQINGERAYDPLNYVDNLMSGDGYASL